MEWNVLRRLYDMLRLPGRASRAYVRTEARDSRRKTGGSRPEKGPEICCPRDSKSRNLATAVILFVGWVLSSMQNEDRKLNLASQAIS